MTRQPPTHDHETILLVDDDLFVRKVVESMLRRAGYTVSVAVDGRDALAKAQRETPDLVICDVNMPRMNGFEFIKQFSGDARFAYVPVIYLTSRRQEQRTGIRLGATDYLLKPVEEDVLLEVVNVRLGNRRLIRQRFDSETATLQHLVSRYLPHELMTPLNGIVTSAAYMKDQDGELSPEEVREFAGFIHTSGMRLYTLAKRFALLGQLEVADEGERSSEREAPPVAFGYARPVVEQVCQQNDRMGDLRVKLAGPGFRASPARLECIFEELADNTCKFSAKGSPIEIVSGEEGGRPFIEFRDSGVGMSDEEIASIGMFRQFRRERREQQGLGLGLAIATRAARLCGLAITFRRNGAAGLVARVEEAAR